LGIGEQNPNEHLLHRKIFKFPKYFTSVFTLNLYLSKKIVLFAHKIHFTI